MPTPRSVRSRPAWRRFPPPVLALTAVLALSPLPAAAASDRGTPPAWPAASPMPEDARPACRGETIGRTVGGLLGLWIGRALFEEGVTRVVGAIGAGLAGAWIGGAIGREIDAGNPACVGRLLDTVPAGRTVTWSDGERRHALQAGPADRRDGLTCRAYRVAVQAADGAAWQEGADRACRQPDGQWRPDPG